MPWPEPLATLLAVPDSRAAQALRWGLHGLRASLQAALADAPGDPGGESLRGLLAELDSLLERGAVSADPVLPPDGSGDRPSPSAAEPVSASLRLLPLVRALGEDRRLQAELRSSPIREGSDEEIWSDVQRLLLRLPSALAGEWRQRSLDHAAQAGAVADEVQVAVVPLPRDELIYPGLTGAIQTAGLRATATAPLDPRLQPPSNGNLRFLAGVVSTYLWFLEHDPHLCHGLKSVFRFGITALNGAQRERYLAELLRLWGRVHAGSAEPQETADHQGFKDHLKDRLDLDEAIHSLLYQPLAAPDSWWGRLRSQARETLFPARDRAVQAGCAVHFQVLGGNFAEINRLAPDSLQVDFGVPGEVAACLRVWARIDGEEIKGRVLYRSPQEEG
jgi:hypothetical protein